MNKLNSTTAELERLRRGIRLARADMTGVARRRFDNIIKKHLGEDL